MTSSVVQILSLHTFIYLTILTTFTHASAKRNENVHSFFAVVAGSIPSKLRITKNNARSFLHKYEKALNKDKPKSISNVPFPQTVSKKYLQSHMLQEFKFNGVLIINLALVSLYNG